MFDILWLYIWLLVTLWRGKCGSAHYDPFLILLSLPTNDIDLVTIHYCIHCTYKHTDHTVILAQEQHLLFSRDRLDIFGLHFKAWQINFETFCADLLSGAQESNNWRVQTATHMRWCREIFQVRGIKIIKFSKIIILALKIKKNYEKIGWYMLSSLKRRWLNWTKIYNLSNITDVGNILDSSLVRWEVSRILLALKLLLRSTHSINY